MIEIEIKFESSYGEYYFVVYKFNSIEEKESFIKGLNEGLKWFDYEIIKQ